MPRKRKSLAKDDEEDERDDGADRADNDKNEKRKVDWTKVTTPVRWKVMPLQAKQIPQSQFAPTKKRKRDGVPLDYDPTDNENEPNKHQTPPFQGSTVGTANYRIEPSDIWMGMDRYRKFSIQDDCFHIGDFVLVKNLESEEDDNGKDSRWVALVLEARASDALHVFLRVYWMYKPEELPDGRRPYHGGKELIASNHMDIIDAASVDDKASVIHWREDNDNVETLDPHQYFWRQTFDINRKRNFLSQLPLHCIDQKEFNPNDLLIHCENCKAWLHNRCIEQAAVKKVYQDNNLQYPENMTTITKGSRKSNGNNDTLRPRSKALVFEARITTGDSNTVILTVTDLRSTRNITTWNAPAITCLVCDKPIDKQQTLPKDVSETSRKAPLKNTHKHPLEDTLKALTEKPKPSVKGNGEARSKQNIARKMGSKMTTPPTTNFNAMFKQTERYYPTKRKRVNNADEASSLATPAFSSDHENNDPMAGISDAVQDRTSHDHTNASSEENDDNNTWRLPPFLSPRSVSGWNPLNRRDKI